MSDVIRCACGARVTTAFCPSCGRPKQADKATVLRVFGACVRDERKRLGMKQHDLARLVGLSRVSVVNIEAGKQNVTVTGLHALAVALGVRCAKLLPFGGRT